MKQSRHEKIRELVATREIGTQEELLGLLRDAGFDVTQATVSRDIRELRLFKTLSPGGEYIYATASGKEPRDDAIAAKFELLFRESALRVDPVLNQVVVKCYTGLANAVCAAFDAMRFDGVVGTLAGDDTILVILRSEEDAGRLGAKLVKKMQEGAE